MLGEWQVPAARRSGPSHAFACIGSPMAFEDASNCGDRRHQATSSLLQCLMNGWRSTLTEHTRLQSLAHAQHATLLAQRGAIPRPMRSARTIFEVTAVQTLAFAALDPKRHIAW